ncbi:hypothetical protein niasHS_004805 [Heterodera schachtii]|uniref:Uncharacterized protein n=1 Tax=Heterodera schachtii TaxID=97005 RepID=A0ABD2JUB9_HETSC
MTCCCLYIIFALCIFFISHVRSADFGRDLSSVQLLLNKQDTFDNELNTSEQITAKRDQIFERWDQLKAALIEKRTKLGESQTLQQFSRDADEVKNWIAEKFQVAQEETHNDPTNIQQKHQKQQAFEVELSANADRIATLITAAKWGGGEPAVSARLRALNDQWEQLVKTTTEKSHRLKQANKQKTFMAAVKDLEFWLGEDSADGRGKKLNKANTFDNRLNTSEAFLSQEDTTGDNVESQIKKREDFDKAIASQQEKLNNLDSLARQLVQAGHYEAPQITAKRDQIFERWDQLKAALIEKRTKLGESQTLQQFSRDADEVENWIAEKFQVAQEETHNDPTNIQQKHQKQQLINSGNHHAKNIGTRTEQMLKHIF